MAEIEIDPDVVRLPRLGNPAPQQAPQRPQFEIDPDVVRLPAVGQAPQAQAPEPQGIQGVGDVLTRLDAGLEQGVRFIPALPFWGYSALDKGVRAIRNTDEPQLPGVETIDPLLNSYFNQAYDVRGITAPDTTSERLTELAPSLLIPAGAVAKGVGGVTAAAKVAAPFIPFAQTTTVAGRGLEAGVAAAATEGMGWLQGQPNVFSSAAQAGQPQAPTEVDPDVVPLPPARSREAFELDVELEVPLAPVGNPDNRYSNAALGALGLLAVGAVGSSVAGFVGARKLDKTLRTSGGPVAGNIMPPEPVGVAAEATVESRSQRIGPTTGVGERVKAEAGYLNEQLFDHLGPRERMIDLGAPSPAAAEQMKATMRNNATSGLLAQVDDFSNTGRLPGTAIKVEPPIVLMKEVSQFDPQTMADFNTITSLSTRIDQSQAALSRLLTRLSAKVAAMPAGPAATRAHARLGTIAARGGAPWVGSGKKMTHADMVAELTAARARSPRAAAAADRHAQINKAFPQFLEEMEIFTHGLRTQVEIENPRYAPQGQQVAQTVGQKVANWFRGEEMKGISGRVRDEPGWLKTRADLSSGEGLGPGEAGPQMISSIRYYHDIIMNGLKNKEKIDELRMLEGLNYHGRPVAIRQKANFEPPKKYHGKMYTQAWDHGVKTWFEITDPGVYSGLQTKGRAGLPMLYKAQQLSAQFMTGALAPLWLTKQIMYDPFMAIYNMPKGRSLGVINGLAKTLGMKGTTRLDLSGFIAGPLLGAGKKVWADAMLSARNAAEASLAKNGWATKVLGQPVVKGLSDTMGAAYERSSFAEMKRRGAVGYGANSTYLDNHQTVAKSWDQLMGKGFRNTPLGRMYLGALETIRMGTKVQYFSTNLERKWAMTPTTIPLGKTGKVIKVPVYEIVTPEAQRRVLARETRELTGDASRAGGDPSTGLGSAVHKITDWTMYGNAFMQGLAQTGRAIKDHPTDWFSVKVAVIGAHMGAVAWVASTDKGRELLREFTPEQLGRYFPMTDAEGNLLGLIATLQEDRPFLAAAAQATLALLGVEGGPEQDHVGEDVRDTFLSVLKSEFIPDFTSNPLTKGAGWFFGKEIRDPNSLTPTDIHENRFANGDVDRLEGGMAWAQGLMGAVIDGSIIMYMDTVMGMIHGLKEGYGFRDTVETGLDVLKSRAGEAKTAGPGYTLWGIDHASSVANHDQKKVKLVYPVIDEIIKKGQETIDKMGMRTRQQGPATLGGYGQDMTGDQTFGQIYVATKALKQRLAPLRQQYNDITTEQEVIRRNPAYSDPKLLFPANNSLVAKKQGLNNDILSIIRDFELGISDLTGTSFRYDNWEG